MAKRKLHVSWDDPLFKGDTDTLVLFRHLGETNLEDIKINGDKIFETNEIKAGFYIDEVEKGEWVYAIFAKNNAGYAPGNIDTYVAFEAILELISLNYKDGVLDFSVNAIGVDISTWSWTINNGSENIVDKTVEDITHNQVFTPNEKQTLYLKAFDENGDLVASKQTSFRPVKITYYFLDKFNTPFDEGSTTVLRNDEVILTATESRGHIFKRWMIQGQGSIITPFETSTKFIAGAFSTIVKGIFEPLYYRLDLKQSVSGQPDRSSAGEIYGQGQYTIADTVKLTAEPEPGYRFVEWIVESGPGSLSNSNSATNGQFTIDNDNVVIEAVFEPIPIKLTLEGPFTENGGGTYIIDNEVSISANPDPGYSFSSWTVVGEGEIQNANAQNTVFTMGSSEATVIATYTAIDYTVTVTGEGQGIETSDRAAFPNNIGQIMNITSQPITGYMFKSWAVTGPGQLEDANSSTTKFTVGAGDAVISASYELKKYTLTVSADQPLNNYPFGTVIITQNLSNTSSLSLDAITQIQASPASGFTFLEWKVGSSASTPSIENPNAATTNVTMGNGDATIVGYFQAQNYTITVTAEKEGAAEVGYVDISQSTSLTNVSQQSASATMPIHTNELGNSYYLKYVPKKNYGFNGWQITGGPGSVSDPNNPVTRFNPGAGDAQVLGKYIYMGRFQDITASANYQSYTQLGFIFSRSADDGQPIDDSSGLNTYFYELATDSSFASIVETKTFSVFEDLVTFDNLTPYIDYYLRCRAVGDVEGTSNTVSFTSNPCGGFSSARVDNGDGTYTIQIRGAEPNSLITVSEETGSVSTRGLVRPIADDEFGNLFIAEGSGKVRTQSSGPGGKLVFDAGFPKFYDGGWTAHASKDIYDAPGQFGYLHNVMKHIQREDNPNNTILYINDSQVGGNYGVGKFNSTVTQVAAKAGMTASFLFGNTSNHYNLLADSSKSKQYWADEFSSYDAIIWFGTSYPYSEYVAQNCIDAILDFFDDGGGLFICTDHSSFQGPSNQILRYYGAKFTGSIDRNINGLNSDGLPAYQISTILGNTEYIPAGYHPLFANLPLTSKISATKSEGKLIYDTSVSSTSQYTTDANGNLDITTHESGGGISNGPLFIKTANDCGDGYDENIVDTDGDGVPDSLDSEPNNPLVTGLDSDLDGIDDAVDTDRDNDGYDDDVDADPDNPYVFTGDGDSDGVDSTIDPNDADASIGVWISKTSDPKLYYDYMYMRGSSLITYSSYYRKNVVGTIPPEAQGCLMARIGTTTSANSGYATTYQYLTPRSTANPSNYTTQGGSTGPRDDYDPYPTVTGIPVETFFRVNIPKGSSHWNTLYSQEWNILPMPYFLNDGTIFAIPFEWNGYYPLYTTQAEAEARSPSGNAHSHAFSWDTGPSNQISGLTWPYWKQETRNVSRTFWMPDGLTSATASTPDRQYLTHYWHGTHPGLPVWSAVYPAGSENGANGYMSKNNGKAFEWIGPQSGNNLAINSSTYNGVLDDLIFPKAVKSPSLTAIKQAINVTNS